ncbi:hypothetical protein B6U83_04590 [Thermoplasmatales archaeon ex4484_36]|nr:MAG: hypothetical protein B6U83_04590 [Thermoplasmatales archaeon ex4484_36]
MIPKFIGALLRGEAPVIYGDGKQTRDFIYVKDVAEVNYLSTIKDIPGGEVINVASGKPKEIVELLKVVEGVLGRALPPRYEPPRPGDIRHSLASVEKMKRSLGFTPRYTLREGIEEMCSEMRG